MSRAAVGFEQLYGDRALPEFRVRRLLELCRQVAPDLQAMQAWRVYFIAWQQPPGQHDRARLAALLEARELSTAAPGVARLWVLPRPGTRPPWSSKAADIFAGCGLHVEVRAGVEWRLCFTGAHTSTVLTTLAAHLHDRMTEVVACTAVDVATLFASPKASAPRYFPLVAEGEPALQAAGEELGFRLTAAEAAALLDHYRRAGRDPTDAELMMYAQFHSEHCRHKIFNARWWLDGECRAHSPFDCIRATSADAARLLSAYRDNAAVLKGYAAPCLQLDTECRYVESTEAMNLVMKVETHNHPTAISPYAGAATGAGGEIRDEAATGQGARPRAGLTGFTVSDLHVPGFIQSWEQPSRARPPHLAAPLEIMLEAPLGAADYNNEFGRPALGDTSAPMSTALTGWVTTSPSCWPAVWARCATRTCASRRPRPGDLLVVLGGPAMRIGVGGGSASSRASGRAAAELDFNSVQRANAQMQRRCQEVIEHCRMLGAANPVRTIHDVGAGGLANAVPESLAGLGAEVRLADVPSDDPSLSPMETWCNEAQERYVLTIAPADLQRFTTACHRERAPYAIIGEVRDCPQLIVAGTTGAAVQVPMELLQAEHAPVEIHASCRARAPDASTAAQAATARTAIPALDELARRVLRLPAVADKGFLITIGDRTVSGRVRRDPLVGPWQVAVADCAVTGEFRGLAGQAMAIGERTPIARLDAPTSGRMAVARGADQPVRGAGGGTGRRGAVRELDGGGRPLRGGRRGTVRDGGRGKCLLPGDRYTDPGRQGLVVHVRAVAG